MRSVPARKGSPVKVRQRTIDFSLWPVRRGRGGWVSNSRLFAADPWPLIRSIVEAACPRSSKAAALAFLEQAHDYFRAASTAGVTAAKPVLLYYCFLNLAKVLVLTRSQAASLDVAKHGLAEKIHAGGAELVGGYLEAYPSNTSVNMFDKLLACIRGNGLPGQVIYDVPLLLRQVLIGHRLFNSANKGEPECFIAIDDVQLLDDGKDRIWLRIGFGEGDLERLGIGKSEFLNRSGLQINWRAIQAPDGARQGMTWFEQSSTTRYTPGWIADSIPRVITSIKPFIWESVLSSGPYRRYYIFMPPGPERPYVLPQVLSIYAVMYYFGSITRYRPHQFDKILDGPYGPFVEEFLNHQPGQLLFLLASEFAYRNVTKAALV